MGTSLQRRGIEEAGSGAVIDGVLAASTGTAWAAGAASAARSAAGAAQFAAGTAGPAGRVAALDRAARNGIVYHEGPGLGRSVAHPVFDRDGDAMMAVGEVGAPAGVALLGKVVDGAVVGVPDETVFLTGLRARRAARDIFAVELQAQGARH